jgi:hypothetical protein
MLKSPKPKLFRRLKHANNKKLAKREIERFTLEKIALDGARTKHINISINVVRSGVYKNLPTFKEKNRDGLPIVQEINYEKEFEREETRNYELINIRTVKIKHGRHKGVKVEVDFVNNPPGVRYNPRSWK